MTHRLLSSAMKRLGMLRPGRLLLCLVVLHGLLPAARAEPAPKEIEFFEQKIRPVLVRQCYACHSQEAQANKKLQGHLFLDSAAGMC